MLKLQQKECKVSKNNYSSDPYDAFYTGLQFHLRVLTKQDFKVA